MHQNVGNAELQIAFRTLHIRSEIGKGISGSIIQNSARWREVFEFSARKVGPNVYTSERAVAKISPSSCPETVR